MLWRLKKDVFSRQFGPYSYFLNQTTKTDVTFIDAESFSREIRRIPRDFEEMVASVASDYPLGQKYKIREDFCEFLSALESGGYIVSGLSEEELNKRDKGFSYGGQLNIGADGGLLDGFGTQECQEHDVLREYFDAHPTPFSIHLDITSECNERCVHCYVPRGRHYYLKAEDACNVIDQFGELGGLQVTLSGGECMLHPEFDRILRHARENDMSVTILSNLYLLDDQKARLLREMNLSLVQTSLYSMDSHIHDAITRLSGSFEKTKSAIEKLWALNVPLQISCPCMKGNFAGYAKVLEYAQGLGVKAYTDFIMMARSDGTVDNLSNRLSLEESRQLMDTIMTHDIDMKEALSSPRKAVGTDNIAEMPMCGVGIDSICLNADGNYYACSGFQGYSLGNMAEDSLKEVWNNSPRIKYLRTLRRKNIPQCVDCSHIGYCSMCLVRNFNENGDMLKVADHFCQVARINHELVDKHRHDMREEHIG